MNAGATASSWAASVGAVEPAHGVHHRADGAVGLRLRLRVAALQRPDRRPHERRALLERLARHAQHELGVGGGAEVVDPELAEAGALRSATPSTFQNAVAPSTRRASIAFTASKPIVVGADLVRVAAVARDDRAQHRVVGGQPGDAGAAARQLARAPHARLREHRRQRALDDRHHADEVAALLARQPEVVDVEDREVGPAGLQQLQRVGRGAGPADRQPHALRVVVAALDGQVDPGVHGVGREVEQQRRVLVRPVAAAGAAAAGQKQAARARGSRERTPGMVAVDGPPRHLLAQSDAVAVADVPLLLQVLRVRDPPSAPARARRGRADPRRRAPPPREGAAGAHRRGAGPPPGRPANA